MDEISVDFPPEDYPILFEFLHPDTGEVVHMVRAEQPANGTKTTIRIPPLSEMPERPVEIRLTFGDDKASTVIRVRQSGR